MYMCNLCYTVRFLLVEETGELRENHRHFTIRSHIFTVQETGEPRENHQHFTIHSHIFTVRFLR